MPGADVITFSFWGHLEQNKPVPLDILLQTRPFEKTDQGVIQSALLADQEVLRQCLHLCLLNDKQGMSSLQAAVLCSRNDETQASF